MKNLLYSFNMFMRKSRFFPVVAILLALSVVASCNEEESATPIVSDRTPELSASVTEIELNQKEDNNTAVEFSWTPGSNYGTNAALDYALQFSNGNDFTDPLTINLGRGIYTSNYRVVDLNNLLLNELGLATEEQAQIYVRIKSTPADDSIEPDFSNVVALSVIPYEAVTTTLYMIGDATPNGWSADSPTVLDVDPEDPTTFSTTVQLAPGNFKFITTQGQFLPSYNKGADESTLVYRSEDSQPDEQFSITEAGLYKVTVNLVDLAISLERVEGPSYTELWVVGSATPKGWDLDNADMMTQSDADPFIFTYSAVLNADGELKIATAKDWGAPFYRPTIADAPVTHAEVQLSAGDPDNKWKVFEAGFYKITLDVRDMTISFDPVDLYLIGDAGPNGWNIGTPEPITKNGAVYTYTGALTAGELKISKFKGDWCGGEWINSATPDQAITNPAYITTMGCDGPDNKWRVTDATAGDYAITIDLESGIMTITPQ